MVDTDIRTAEVSQPYVSSLPFYFVEHTVKGKQDLLRYQRLAATQGKLSLCYADTSHTQVTFSKVQRWSPLSVLPELLLRIC